MKKIYFSILCLGFVSSVNAQKLKGSIVEVAQIQETQSTFIESNGGNSHYGTKELGQEIWSDNFDTGANWVADNSGQVAPFGWNIGTTVNSWWGAFSGGINSTSGGGFAEVYNGNYNNNDQQLNVTYTLTSIALDIPNLPLNTTSTENVILSFEQFGALFNDDQTVQISVDGGTVWNDIFTNNNHVTFVGNNPDAIYGNSEKIQVNLSQYVIGNSSNVKIRFLWTSRFASSTSLSAWTTFGWFIDDVKLLTQPTNDVQVLSTYIVGSTNEGIEYGRTPVGQLDTDWIVGATVLNFGSMNQPSTNLTADFGTFTSVSSNLVEADSTRQVESIETPALATGVYTGNYTVVAGSDTMGGGTFSDNTGSRTFEVTSAQYSIDGIGVYPTTSTSTSGTASFNGTATPLVNQDNVFFGSMYHFKNTAIISSIQVMLGASTVAGGDVYGSIIDTAVYLNNATTPKLAISNPVTITSTDVSNGYVTLEFPGGYTIAPGAYFACVELISNAGTNTISIMDDETIGQPFYASMINIPDAVGTTTAGTYSNGTAFAIRLNMGFAGLKESTLSNVEVYPNPSNGVVTITNEDNSTNDIAIFDMLGKQVYTTTATSKKVVDLSANGTGVYLVKVSNEKGSIVKRVVIK